MDIFTKQKTATLLIILLVVLNLLTLSKLWLDNPNSPPFQHPDGNRSGGDLLALDLRFSPKQNKQFQKMRNDHFAKVEPIKKEIHDLKREIMKLAFESENSGDEIEMLAKKIGESQIDLEIEIYNHFSEVKNICDQKQKIQLKKVLMRSVNLNPPPPPRPPKGFRN